MTNMFSYPPIHPVCSIRNHSIRKSGAIPEVPLCCSPRLVPLRVSFSVARCPGAAGSGSCRCVCLVCVVVAACLVVFRGLVGWSVVSLVSGPVCVGLSRRRVAVGLSVWSGWGLAPFVSSARRVWFRLTPALSLVWLWAGVTASAPLGWPQTPGPWVTHSN